MKIKSGFAFHCHHDELAEFVSNYDERVEAIKRDKPVKEQELRLRLFRLIPSDRIPQELVKAREACDKAWEAYGKAREAYDKAWEAYGKAREACDKAWEAYRKAWEAYRKASEAHDKAWEAYRKAWEAYGKAREACDNEFGNELNELHKTLCPDCPWDGKTIFTRKNDKGEWY